MKLFAISDLHLGFDANRTALAAMAPHYDDWLVLAGDVGESASHLEFAIRTLQAKFARLIWVPGNHELWTVASDPLQLKGVARYEALVDLCRRHDVLTPEDAFPLWTGEGGPCTLAPLFLLYDYSFRPAGVPLENAVAWASESGVLCADERWLSPEPYTSREEWCHARCATTASRLEGQSGPLVLINHFPLRSDLVYLPRIPRFSIWCGTRKTEDWHVRYNAQVVVSGHLHVRSTRWIDGVRFEEVSFGYPRQRQAEAHVDTFLRQILPGPAAPSENTAATFYR